MDWILQDDSCTLVCRATFRRSISKRDKHLRSKINYLNRFKVILLDMDQKKKKNLATF